jgi:hypothetical protein
MLPPGVNPTAVNKIYISYHIKYTQNLIITLRWIFGIFQAVLSYVHDSTNKRLTGDASRTDASVVSVRIGTCGIVLTRVVFTELDACGTVIACKTLATATLIAVHSINAHFVVRTDRLNAVINIHLTVSTIESYDRNRMAHDSRCTRRSQKTRFPSLLPPNNFTQ